MFDGLYGYDGSRGPYCEVLLDIGGSGVRAVPSTMHTALMNIDCELFDVQTRRVASAEVAVV